MSRSSRPPAAAIAALLSFAFAALYAGASRGVFLYGDDVLMFQVTESLVERGEVSVSSTAPQGEATHSIAGVDGRRYAKYGFAQSLVAAPFHAASRALFGRFELPEARDAFGNLRTGAVVFGTSLVNAAIGGAAVGLLFLLAAEVGLSVLAALAAALLLGLATPWLHYSSTFLSEPLAGMSLVLAVLGLSRAEREARTWGCATVYRGWLAIAGFAAGLAVATKVALLVAIWPLAVWAVAILWRGRRNSATALSLLAFASPLLIWLAAILAYNAARFGSALETGYGDEARNFATPVLAGLAGLLFSPAKGLVFYWPLIVLALFGWPELHRRRRSLSFAIAAGSVSHLALVANYYNWYGGDAWGPRLLVPLMPLWLLPAGVALQRWGVRGRGARLAAAALTAVSLAISLSSVLVPFDAISARFGSVASDAAPSAWTLPSPIAGHLAQLPGAARVTVAKLAATDGPRATGEGLARPPYPDFAFVRYGSHALLQWTRSVLAAGLLALATAGALVFRAQKALLSRPPQ